MSNISEMLKEALVSMIKEPKYKVGDRVKAEEDLSYTYRFKKRLSELDPPFVLTIKRVSNPGYYYVEENDNCWWRGNIEGLYVEPIPVMSRFELLDLGEE